MKILITGCNGLVGCSLAKKISSANIKVFGLSKNGLTNPYMLNDHYFQVDICDRKTISSILEVIQPDIIVHAAAITKPDVCELDVELCYNVNFKAVKIIFEESRKRNIYTIHLSTDFIFAGNTMLHDELSNDFPSVNVYGLSKYNAEQYIVEHHPTAAIVRTALVYGYEPLLPRGNILTWAVAELQRGNQIRVVNDQFRTPTFADDLANGIYALFESKLAGIFNIAGEEFMSVYDFVVMAANVFDLNKNLIIPVETSTLNESAKRPPSTNLSIDKAKYLLKYSPHSVTENLKNIHF